MKLERLTRQEVSTLSEMMLGQNQPVVVDLLAAQTEGNVYFLVEIVRALAEDAGNLMKIGSTTLPESIFTGGIRAVIDRRLDQIHDADYELLELAAVGGRVIDEPAMRTFVEDTRLTQWLFSCAAASVLEVNQGRWRFAHDKLREGVLVRLPASRVRQLHRDFAQAIEAAYPIPADHAARLAYHWHIAGDLQAEVHYALLAAKLSDGIYAIHDANALYTQAINALEQLPDSTKNRRLRLEALVKRAVAELTLVTPVIYLAHLSEANQILEKLTAEASASSEVSDTGNTAGDQLWAGHIQLQLGHAYFGMSNLPEAVKHYHDALHIGHAYKNDNLTAQASSVLGRLMATQGKNVDAEALITEAKPLLEKLHLNHQWYRTNQLLALVRAGRGDCQEGLAMLTHVRALAEADNNWTAASVCSTISCVIYLTMYGDLDKAAVAAQESIVQARKFRDLTSLYIPYGYTAWVESRRHNDDAAAYYRQQANEIADAFGGFLLWTETFFGVEAEIEWNAGRIDNAQKLCEKALNYATRVDSVLNLARIHRLMGSISADSTQAETHFTAGLQVATNNDLRIEAMNIHITWGTALIKQGNIAAGRDHLELARVQARTSQLPLRLAEIERA